MPLINVKLIEEVFTSEQKQQIAKPLTEAMVAIEGRTAALPAAGDQCRVIAWPDRRDGRKLTAGSALLGPGRQGLAARPGGVADRAASGPAARRTGSPGCSPGHRSSRAHRAAFGPAANHHTTAPTKENMP